MLQPRKVSIINYFLAIAVRLILMKSSYKICIQDRVEITTPLNSWKRLLEGIHLYDINVDPYSGDLFHESPLVLIGFRFLISSLGQYIEVLYVFIDVLIAQLLFKATRIYIYLLKKEEEEKLKNGIYSKISKTLVLTEADTQNIPVYVAYAYLFNPYIIFNCVGLTTTIFSNLLLSGFFYCMVKKKKFFCVLLLSLVTQHSFYPFVLLVPLCLEFYKYEKSLKGVIEIIVLFIIMLSGLLVFCYHISGSWEFIKSTYVFILFINDLTPNIGLFWYFFTEMFDHFRALFISALQINATILYLFPLALHLKNEPVFLSFVLVALTTIFKSYPSLGDVGFYFSIIPIWKQLFFFMQQSFITTCFLIVTSLLGPTVWHLWIYAGAANANFFFGVTLAFATAQIFLVTDLLFAHKKRDFALKKGIVDDSADRTLILD